MKPEQVSRCECCKLVEGHTKGTQRLYRCSVDSYTYLTDQPLTCGAECREALRAELSALDKMLTFGGKIVRSPIEL